MNVEQKRLDVGQTTAALISGDLEDEELSRLFLGSALDPDPYDTALLPMRQIPLRRRLWVNYDPSTNAATE